MNDPSGLAIETAGLTKRYGDLVAVDGLDLAIPAGSVFGFIGPNGAGKSSTLRMLMGLTRRTSGEARVLGVDVGARDPALRRRLGYVPEVPTLYRWMRVREAIGFCRTLYGRWNDELCRDLVRRFDLDPGQKIGGLSRGMSAKLSLLLAIAHEPEVLILDEPTTGLDPMAREEFLDGVLHALCEGPRTVLFSSHVLSDVQRMADNVGILFQGRLLVDSPTDELMQNTRRLRVVLEGGVAPEAALTPPSGTIWQRFERREWLLTVHGFSSGTLEDVRRRFPVERLEVEALGLEDIFKDFIRGQEAAS